MISYIEAHKIKEQWTLEKLIKSLEQLPQDATIYMNNPHSYRGNYNELAFENNPNIVKDLLQTCQDKVLNKSLPGYKSGEYLMDFSTPVWISTYGENHNTPLIGLSGTKLNGYIPKVYTHYNRIIYPEYASDSEKSNDENGSDSDSEND